MWSNFYKSSRFLDYRIKLFIYLLSFSLLLNFAELNLCREWNFTHLFASPTQLRWRCKYVVRNTCKGCCLGYRDVNRCRRPPPPPSTGVSDDDVDWRHDNRNTDCDSDTIHFDTICIVTDPVYKPSVDVRSLEILFVNKIPRKFCESAACFDWCVKKCNLIIFVNLILKQKLVYL